MPWRNGRLGVILGCRALVLLHDDQGHPLLATTHRADQHLIVGLPSVIARYEDSKERAQVKRIIVDREGMATEFLVRLHARSDEPWSRSYRPLSIRISPHSATWEPLFLCVLTPKAR
jgi:hypothetical protein